MFAPILGSVTLSLLALGPPAADSGAACTPPTSYKSSEVLKQAIRKATCSKSGSGLGISVPGIGGVSFSSESLKCDTLDTNEESARNVIREYLHTPGSLLAAECGFRACEFARTDAPALAYDLLANICSGSSEGGPVAPIIVLDGDKSGEVKGTNPVVLTFTIKNRTGLSVSLAPRVSGSTRVKILTPRAELTLPANAARTVKVRVTPPKLRKLEVHSETFAFLVNQADVAPLPLPAVVRLHRKIPALPSWSCVAPTVTTVADCEQGGLGGKNSGRDTGTDWRSFGSGTFCHHDIPNGGHAQAVPTCGERMPGEAEVGLSIVSEGHGGLSEGKDCSNGAAGGAKKHCWTTVTADVKNGEARATTSTYESGGLELLVRGLRCQATPSSAVRLDLKVGGKSYPLRDGRIPLLSDNLLISLGVAGSVGGTTPGIGDVGGPISERGDCRLSLAFRPIYEGVLRFDSAADISARLIGEPSPALRRRADRTLEPGIYSVELKQGRAKATVQVEIYSGAMTTVRCLDLARCQIDVPTDVLKPEP